MTMFNTEKLNLSLLTKLPKLMEFTDILIKLYPSRRLREEQEPLLIEQSKIAIEQFKKRYKGKITNGIAYRLAVIRTLISAGDLQFDLPTLVKMSKYDFLFRTHTSLSIAINNAVSYTKVEALLDLLRDEVSKAEEQYLIARAKEINPDNFERYNEVANRLIALQEDLKIGLQFNHALQALIFACYSTYNNVVDKRKLDVTKPEYIPYPLHYANQMAQLCLLSSDKLEEVINRDWIKDNLLDDSPTVFKEFINQLTLFVKLKEKYFAR